MDKIEILIVHYKHCFACKKLLFQIDKVVKNHPGILTIELVDIDDIVEYYEEVFKNKEINAEFPSIYIKIDGIYHHLDTRDKVLGFYKLIGQ